MNSFSLSRQILCIVPWQQPRNSQSLNSDFLFLFNLKLERLTTSGSEGSLDTLTAGTTKTVRFVQLQPCSHARPCYVLS